MLIETREDIKYSPRALILLIGLQLVDMKQLDEFLAKVRIVTYMYNGNEYINTLKYDYLLN